MKEYNKKYKIYLDSIKNNKERPENIKKINSLAKEAKANWDLYVKKECLAEALVFEKGSYGFNDTYHSCLINNYTKRIKYYKENKI
ncbi:DUF1311 domain-containing protein [Rosenbergiella sp. S61]|uniref:DUF1311 domain-containing protein n=1 Tax=Rosenbergiella gaditana TaxID=2726987 RepID=A0ABS5SSZ8_9GAMM|nr:lysozyme inhibitor LprI family protein [Rosenbergiella gaditana]MBT0723146.1 DUF1311 domain-containing protein [Rosenbergiella gaditana]